MGLLAAEMTARTGKDPGQLYNELTAKYGAPVYQRIDAAATKEQKAKLAKLSPAQVTAKTLAGEPITAILTEAPGNHAAHRRPQSHHRKRLVRRPPLRHRRRLQNLRRKLQRRSPPETNPDGSQSTCRISNCLVRSTSLPSCVHAAHHGLNVPYCRSVFQLLPPPQNIPQHNL